MFKTETRVLGSSLLILGGSVKLLAAKLYAYTFHFKKGFRRFKGMERVTWALGLFRSETRALGCSSSIFVFYEPSFKVGLGKYWLETVF